MDSDAEVHPVGLEDLHFRVSTQPVSKGRTVGVGVIETVETNVNRPGVS